MAGLCEGRVAIVTGGGRGIGREHCLMLAAEGAAVAIAARGAAALDAARRVLVAAGARSVTVVVADLAAPGEPERTVAEAASALGGLDVLVNNVGAARQCTLAEVDDGAWLASFAINLLAPIRATRAALPFLRSSDQARIVNVSSTAGKRPSGAMPDYSVMKAGLLSFSRLVADAEAANGVLCNAVCPGPALTPTWLAEGGLADQMAARSGTDRATALARTGAGRPLGRLAEPGEIAAVITFLCSAQASYVTGSAWSADGGTVPIII